MHLHQCSALQERTYYLRMLDPALLYRNRLDTSECWTGKYNTQTFLLAPNNKTKPKEKKKQAWGKFIHNYLQNKNPGLTWMTGIDSIQDFKLLTVFTYFILKNAAS